MEIITSTENKKVKAWCSLQNKKCRDQSGLFLVQSKHLITEAINAGALKELIVRAGVTNEFSVQAITISDAVMKKLQQNVSLNDYIGVCEMKTKPIRGRRIVVCENVQDPGNVGTIIRTATAFGYDGVIMNEGCCDLYNEKTIQSSQGALFQMPILRLKNEDMIEWIQSRGYQMIATDVHNSFTLSDLEPAERYAIIMGNEGQGISEGLLKKCDARVRIEMDGFESLNVAVAAGVIMYECRYRKDRHDV